VEQSVMPYSAEISRTNPTCFLFLIDQSGSMAQPIRGSHKKKAEFVADAVNRLLQTLVLRCAKSDGVRDYFHVGVIGYGEHVGPALGGLLSGRRLTAISEVANKPLRIEQRTKKVEDGAGGVVEQTVKFPVWFEPVAGGKTPMCKAFDLAWEILSDFLVRAPACYPPMVINVTDGEPTDGNPEAHATCLRDLASRDGNVLLFNLHISSSDTPPTEFPDRENTLADAHARRLFRMSSLLPAPVRTTALREGYTVTDTTRGFVFNADLVSVVRFLDIGTRVDNKNLR
jgi:hypothetical protein